MQKSFDLVASSTSTREGALKMDAITSPKKKLEGGELGIVPPLMWRMCAACASNIDEGYSMF